MTKPAVKFNIYYWDSEFFKLQRVGSGKTGNFPNEFSSLEDCIDHVLYRRNIAAFDASVQFVIIETDLSTRASKIIKLINPDTDTTKIFRTNFNLG